MKFVSEDMLKLLADELRAKREELQLAHQRIDALMQALAAKGGTPLLMPRTLPPFPQELEKSSGYFDTKRSVIPPAISGGNKS